MKSTWSFTHHHNTPVVLQLATLAAAAVILGIMAPVVGFTHSPSSLPSFHTRLTQPKTFELCAEAPKYQKLGGILQHSEYVGPGSYLLTVDYNPEDSNENEDYPIYEPGHVLALEIQPPSSDDSSDGETPECEDTPLSQRLTTVTEKTQKDLTNNGGWLRGPYTVSFGYGSNDGNGDKPNDGFRVLIKEVGYKSHVMATAPPGTPVMFGGKFKVPIAEGIMDAAASAERDDGKKTSSRGATKRVVLVSSGVGVGPCLGAIETLTNSDQSSSITNIDLIASFRTPEETAVIDNLEIDDDESPVMYRYKLVVTSEKGRLTSMGSEVLQIDYLSNPDVDDSVSAVTETHYHIIGNGQLVNEWKEGLNQAGVPLERVTVESYFNHSEKPDPTAVEAISEAVLGLDRETVAAAVEEFQEETAS